MPREKGIRGMLENTLKFEVQLHEFLDVDYGGLCDRVAIPDEGSLVGYDGTFLLYRLAESPLFDALRSSIKSISEVASNVLANTRGKAAFDWIRQVFDWMDAMRANVTITDSRIGAYQLSIPFAEAKNLLRLGDQIFLDLSEELRKTLSNHKIHVAKDKDGKLIVKSKKGDAHHSLGSTCIRWCPFLYDALTFNVLQFEHWESRVSKLSKDFLLIRQYAEAKAPNHPIVLHRYYGCREELTQLLEEGTDLVVSPAETLIESCRALFTSVDSHLRSHSNFEAAKLFAESRYSSDTVVIENSQVLLDSLVERTRLTCGFANTSLDEISKEGPFRRAGRAAFVIALQNAVRTLHIADPSGASYSFCAIKAWEIENALFDLYQRDLGECQISSEYRDKARVLRRSLEDSENLHLAVSVLCERICCDDLVQMTVEQLANPTVKKDREKAAEAARQNLVLTGSSATTKISSLEKSQHNNEVGGTNLPAEGPVTQVQLLRPQKPMVQLQIRKLNSPLHKTSTAISTTSVEFPPSMSPISSTRTTSKFGDLIKAARARGPPPPPPSLVAMSLKPVAREHLSSSNNGEAATTLSGGNIFSLSLAEGTRTFSATLHAEGDSKVNAHGLLPGVLKETGRLKADDFTYFIRGKLDGGRWEAVAFRLATVSDKDAKEHKKFYKEYEGKKRRIAMFSLGDGKAFLVTPKYHRLAKALTFARSTSTYIIVLTKKE